MWNPDQPTSTPSGHQQHRPRQWKADTKPKPYETLTNDEKWHWHANNYAFRHVVLGQPLQSQSPCDPYGHWFDENLVRNALAAKFPPKPGRSYLQREGRTIANQWAQIHGYRDMDDALEAGASYVDVIKAVLEPLNLRSSR